MSTPAETVLEGLTREEVVLVHEAVGWDDRKTLAEVYQAAGGVFGPDGLNAETYRGLIAVGQWAAARAVYYVGDD